MLEMSRVLSPHISDCDSQNSPGRSPSRPARFFASEGDRRHATTRWQHAINDRARGAQARDPGSRITLFGLLGIALATPLVAVIRLLVLRLYVDDALGGAHVPATARANRD